jgi:hypothetical protein
VRHFDDVEPEPRLTVSARTIFDLAVACLAMKQASAATVVPS